MTWIEKDGLDLAKDFCEKAVLIKGCSDHMGRESYLYRDKFYPHVSYNDIDVAVINLASTFSDRELAIWNLAWHYKAALMTKTEIEVTPFERLDLYDLKIYEKVREAMTFIGVEPLPSIAELKNEK